MQHALDAAREDARGRRGRLRCPFPLADQDRARSLWRTLVERDTPVDLAPALLSVRPNSVSVGGISVPARPLPGQSKDAVVAGQLAALKAVLCGVQQQTLVLLTGTQHVGKASVARTAAALTGNVLKSFSMNHSVDTIDLIGGYEQVDFERHRRALIQDVEDTLLMQRVADTHPAVVQFRAHFTSARVLDELPVKTQLSLLNTLKSVTLFSFGDVRAGFAHIVSRVQSVLCTVFGVPQVDALPAALSQLSPRVAQLYATTAAAAPVDAEHIDNALIQHGLFLLSVFRVPKIDPMDFPHHLAKACALELRFISEQRDLSSCSRATSLVPGSLTPTPSSTRSRPPSHANVTARHAPTRRSRRR